MGKLFKGKHQPTYQEAHNKAVKLFKKTSSVFIWVAILNIFSAIFGVFNIGASSNSENGINYRYSLTLALNRFIFDILDGSELNSVISKLLIMVIALASGALFVLLGRLSSMGKIKYLYAGGAIYLVDFIALFVYDNILGSYLGKSFNWTLYAFALVTHIVVIMFVCIAIFEYYKVITIEKHKNDNIKEK